MAPTRSAIWILVLASPDPSKLAPLDTQVIWEIPLMLMSRELERDNTSAKDAGASKNNFPYGLMGI